MSEAAVQIEFEALEKYMIPYMFEAQVILK